MTRYTVTRTEITERTFEAESPEDAIEQAQALTPEQFDVGAACVSCEFDA